jgi:hypothetical protein
MGQCSQKGFKNDKHYGFSLLVEILLQSVQWHDRAQKSTPWMKVNILALHGECKPVGNRSTQPEAWLPWLTKAETEVEMIWCALVSDFQ